MPSDFYTRRGTISLNYGHTTKDVFSCKGCGALVVKADTAQHDIWHASQDALMSDLLDRTAPGEA